MHSVALAFIVMQRMIMK